MSIIMPEPIKGLRNLCGAKRNRHFLDAHTETSWTLILAHRERLEGLPSKEAAKPAFFWYLEPI